MAKRVKEASRDGFEASIDHIGQDAMHQFEKGCKGNAMLTMDSMQELSVYYFVW